MYKIKTAKAEDIFPIIKEILVRGKRVRITVTGMSMYPFLRENIDSVELAPGSFNDIQRGDIVLILRDNAQYVLHRVLHKEKNYFYIVGDAQQWIEGPLRPDQLIAVIPFVWREKFYINCSALWWKILSSLWLSLLPLRYFILKIYGNLRQIM